MSWIETVAVVFGFLSVVLTIRRNIWCWPVGMVQVLLFIVIFYQVKLYSDLGLHVIYVGLQFYGWFCWTRAPDEVDGPQAARTHEVAAVNSLSSLELLVWIGTTVIGTTALGWIMQSYTDASIPFGDAFTTVASLVATYLLAHKKLESWMFWIAVDVIAIGIYFHKELYQTSILYVAFLVLAIIGYFAWRKIVVGEPLTLEPAQ